ncbi:MAG: prepilin peptidase [Coriobacteriia bacterium]|jgi:leader peptidase (prepilin peptidase)/N-methyltransferase|nr:prepilin peptidase [Coriobacteriia bacterium]
MPDWFFCSVLFIFGLLTGSFANVVIWRFPRGESVVSPPSACPRCMAQIQWYDNIPVVSWLVLRGRCRECGEPISPRYPAVELLCGVLWLAAGLRFGMSLQTAFAIVLFFFLLLLAFIDLDTMRLPNPIVGALFVIGVGGVVFSQLTDIVALPLTPLGRGIFGEPVAMALLGALASGGVALAIAGAYALIRKREGFGMGDVKLLGSMGVYLGLYGVLVFFAGSILGAAYGIAMNVKKGDSLATKFPFGPFLALAGVLVALFGPAVWSWYLGLLG